MGYAVVKGKYHKGPKKNTKRARSSTAAKPARSRTDRVLEDNRDLIAALSRLNGDDMATFVKSTTGPNPTGCTLVVQGGDAPIVNGGHGGLAYVAGLGGHGGTGATFPRGGSIVAVVPNEPTRNEPREEIVGYIVNYPPPKGGELLVFASTELLVHISNNLLIE